MAIAELFLNLHNYRATAEFSEGELDAIALLFPLNFDETGDQIKQILEKRYTDGISGFEGVKVEGSKIVGVFYDIVSPSLTKKFNFTIDADKRGVDYTQIDTGNLEQNFSEYEFAAPVKQLKIADWRLEIDCTHQGCSFFDRRLEISDLFRLTSGGACTEFNLQSALYNLQSSGSKSVTLPL